MPATPTVLSHNKRFMFRGIGRVVWIPTVAAGSFIPTLTEISAGSDLSNLVAGADGWNVDAGFIDSRDAGSTTVAKIRGEVTLSDSSMDFHLPKSGSTAADIRTLLTEGLTGFMGLFNHGLAAGALFDLYPVEVASVNTVSDVAGTATTYAHVAFALTATPARNVPVPAS